MERQTTMTSVSESDVVAEARKTVLQLRTVCKARAVQLSNQNDKVKRARREAKDEEDYKLVKKLESAYTSRNFQKLIIEDLEDALEQSSQGLEMLKEEWSCLHEENVTLRNDYLNLREQELEKRMLEMAASQNRLMQPSFIPSPPHQDNTPACILDKTDKYMVEHDIYDNISFEEIPELVLDLPEPRSTCNFDSLISPILSHCDPSSPTECLDEVFAYGGDQSFDTTSPAEDVEQCTGWNGMLSVEHCSSDKPRDASFLFEDELSTCDNDSNCANKFLDSLLDPGVRNWSHYVQPENFNVLFTENLA